MPTIPDNLHWRDSLLGDSFWQEQDMLNQFIDGRDKPDLTRVLHRRFPFNLSLSDGNPPRRQHSQKKRRRFSTSDAYNLDTHVPAPMDTVDSTFPGNWSGDGNIDDRDSVSSTSHFLSWISFMRKAASLLRVPFKPLSIADSGSSTTTRSHDSNSISSGLGTTIRKDLGSTRKPLLAFRGGASWNCLPRDMETLCIDLCCPVKDPKDTEAIKETERLGLAQMAPLGEFRNLRVLRITGMMQSYQRYIWQTAWLNPGLVELELGMALPPRIWTGFAGKLVNWRVIKGDWKIDKSCPGDPVYYGGLGDGNLHPKLGTGEYLDKLAIEKAKILAGVTAQTLNRLSIRKLTLSGFVVDADPFIQWFDPSRLRAIHFRDDCIDAGIYLPKSMRRVNITFPRDNEQALPARRLDLVNDLKLVDLKGGKSVGEIPYRYVGAGLDNGDRAKDGKKSNRSMSTPPVFNSRSSC